MGKTLSTDKNVTVVSRRRQEALDLPQPQDVADLGSKLHHGHDPNSADQERSLLLGNTPFAKRVEDKHVTAAQLHTGFKSGHEDSTGGKQERLPDSQSIESEELAPDTTAPLQTYTLLHPHKEGVLPPPAQFIESRSQTGFQNPHTASSPRIADGDSNPQDFTPPLSQPPVDPEQSPLQSPIVTLASITGTENQSTQLIIHLIANTDSDVTTWIELSGLPSGALLSAGHDDGHGIWILTPNDLDQLWLTLPQDWSGHFNLLLAAHSLRGTELTSSLIQTALSIEGVATPPNLTIQNTNGTENSAIALNITAAITDIDNSETLSITISGVPIGAVLSAGTNNGNGSWTLTSADLNGLTLTPPSGWSGNIPLTVTAISNEGGTTASTSSQLFIAVAGLATTPSLHISNTNGTEDTALPLSIQAALADTDGSESLRITISGIPSGAVLNHGTDIGNGTWALMPPDLNGLTLTPPLHWSGNLNLSITATSSENGTTASTSSTLSVTVSGSATPPSLTIQPASGTENNAISLNINSTLIDTDGSETLSITVSDVPAGASLSAGIDNGNGSWTLTPTQLSGLTITPPANYSGNFNLTITATSSENNTYASAQALLGVTVAGVADAPIISVQAANGNEDSAIPLNIASALIDTDGSETLNITISGVPADTTLSAGTNNGNGTWLLAPADLAGLTLTPPLHWSGNLNLIVTATSIENGTTASTSSPLSVAVAGLATPPNLVVQAANGNEDIALPLDITATLMDTDGSETLSVTISNVPVGATLSAGVENGNGTWTLTPAQLTGVQFTPPLHWSGNLTLAVTATSSENGTTASTSSNLNIVISGSVTPPFLVLQNASGNEDTATPLSINSALINASSGETLSILISGVPAGASLSAGINNGNGHWTLIPAELSGLTITPPTNWSGNLILGVTAIAQDGVYSASTNGIIAISITEVADTPLLSVHPASGNEDTSIALDITAALTDTDGSESLNILIEGLPSGAVLSSGIDNGNGKWTLSPAQLSGLTLTPPAGYSGNLNLTVTAISGAGAITSSTSTSLNVAVTAVASPPVLSLQNASGHEDSPVALNINAGLTDADGSESLSITISGIPTGATLSAGIDNGNGTWLLAPADLAGLTLSPPLHWSGNLSLTVTATSSENGSTSSTSSAFSISIAGIATPPTVSVQAANGAENTAITLNITAGLIDTDGSETLSIIVSGVPTGASLSAGVDNGNGTWNLMPADLAHLTMTPPDHYSGNFNLTIIATASENGTTAATQSTLAVTVIGVADAPSLSVQAATGSEDNAIPLIITTALTDTDGSEALTITVSGIPTGATLSAGTDNGNGSWTLTPMQLSGLTLAPPPNYSGNFNLTVTSTASENGTTASTVAHLGVTITGVSDAPILSVHSASGSEDTAIPLTVTTDLSDTDGFELLSITITGMPVGAALNQGSDNGNGSWTLTPAQLSGLTILPPSNYSGSFNLTITSTASENGTTASTQAILGVTITSVADVPTLSVQAAIGSEDTAIPLTISAGLTDMDGSESLSIVIDNVPLGFILNKGIDNGNGSWVLAPTDLTGLALTPPLHWSGALNLTVTATSSENGVTSSIATILGVTVNGTADTPLLSVQSASGNEDSAIALNIASTQVGSESLSITISGVPAGATLSAGTDNGNGTWTLTPVQLSGLALIPPSNYSGNLNLIVTSTASENGTTASTQAILSVSIAGSADTPMLSAQAATGSEDSTIPLTITANLIDTDGSESLSIMIGNVPPGAILSAGTDNGNGTWTLAPADLANLTFTPPLNYSGSFTLSITATASENGSNADSFANLQVTVGGVADSPLLAIQAASGNEDTAIPLSISASLTDTDSSESLQIVINGIPMGATLNKGIDNGNGTWTLTSAQLSSLTITPPTHWSGNFVLSVTATAYENGTTAPITVNLPVSVAGVPDTPQLSVQAASGNEDSTISLDISSALVDTDGSESLSVIISGIPLGSMLNHGTDNGNGTWTLTSAQLSGLTITPPNNFSGSFTLNVTAIASENNATAQTLTTLSVTVAAIADTPTLSVQAASGNEDSAIALNIIAGLSDSSESLSITITGVPAGAMLSAGIDNSNGTWTLSPAQLSGLTLTPPLHYSGSFNLTVTATSNDSGSTTDLSAHLVVSVAGVPDAPSLAVQNANGNEDGSIALNIAAGLIDTDGSETLSIIVSGVPTGASLSAGVDNGNGTWNLMPADLAHLTMTPSAGYSGSFNLTVTAITGENNATASTSTTLNVIISGIADAPSLSVQAASGNEDTAIPLSITSALNDMDGSESLSITITGVPTGATLNKGINNGNGSWTLTPAQLPGLTITPPTNYSGSFNLTVTSTASENGTTANTQATLGVTITGVADAPLLSVQTASGNEDSAIPLNITSTLMDTDGSETLSIMISGVPTGATLNKGINNGNGSWTLTPAQLSGLAITPPANSNSDFTLTVTATASENGTTVSTQTNLPIIIKGLADTPNLSVSNASGNEDTAIALSISGSLADTDGSESLSFNISGVPTGALLSAGTYAGNGTWSLTAAQLSGLTITPSANYSGVMALTVKAISTENDSGYTSASAALNVTVNKVADQPSLYVSSASGNEDSAIPLNITSALVDTDGSESLSITITGVPTGAILNKGINNGGGSWTLTPAQLVGLTITPATNSDADFTLTVTATSTESGGGTASRNTSLAVTVNGVADAPAVTAGNITGASGTQISLNITPASLTDTDGSESALTYVIKGMPDGFALNKGINNGDNTWTVTAAQLTGLTLTTPEQFNGRLTLSVAAVAHESDGAVAMGAPTSFYAYVGTWATGYLIDITAEVAIGGIGLQAHAGVGPNIDLFPAAGGLIGNNIYAKEDTAFLIADAPNLLALPAISAILHLVAKIQFTNIPTGTTFSQGTNLGGGVWEFTQAQLNNLYMTPLAGSDVDFTLTARAKLISLAYVNLVSTTVHVMGMADTPTLSASAGSVINEDGSSIPLTITGALSVNDTDGSESLSFEISGLPSGFILNKGINNGNGSWSLTSADLSGLTLTPPTNWSGASSFIVSAIATEREGDQSVVQQTVNFNVTPIADAPTISTQNHNGTEDSPIMLNFGVSLKDTDGSESISAITVSGLPSGASLTNATNNGDGTWSINVAQMSNVQFVPPSHWSGDITLNLTVTSQENANGVTANTNSTLAVHIAPVADTPSIFASNITDHLNTPIGLNISAGLTDSSEQLSIVVSGMPTGALLSQGLHNADSTWTLTSAQLAALSITPPTGFTGDMHLTATAYSFEADGSSASAQQDFSVHVDYEHVFPS